MPPNISISSWNINGISNKIIGDKTKNEDFLNHIKPYDFVFLTETWTNSPINISGFRALSSNTAPSKSISKSRLSGGITLLFKNKFENHVTLTKKSTYSLWCKISKDKLKSNKDPYLGRIYYHLRNRNTLITKFLIN